MLRGIMDGLRPVVDLIDRQWPHQVSVWTTYASCVRDKVDTGLGFPKIGGSRCRCRPPNAERKAGWLRDNYSLGMGACWLGI